MVGFDEIQWSGELRPSVVVDSGLWTGRVQGEKKFDGAARLCGECDGLGWERVGTRRVKLGPYKVRVEPVLKRCGICGGIGRVPWRPSWLGRLVGWLGKW